MFYGIFWSIAGNISPNVAVRARIKPFRLNFTATSPVREICLRRARKLIFNMAGWCGGNRRGPAAHKPRMKSLQRQFDHVYNQLKLIMEQFRRPATDLLRYIVIVNQYFRVIKTATLRLGCVSMMKCELRTESDHPSVWICCIFNYDARGGSSNFWNHGILLYYHTKKNTTYFRRLCVKYDYFQ